MPEGSVETVVEVLGDVHEHAEELATVGAPV